MTNIKDTANRPSANPGGMECQTCGRIFIGDESHSECGLCHNTRAAAEDHCVDMRKMVAGDGEAGSGVLSESSWMAYLEDDELDQAIDAAMAAERGEPEHD